MLNLALVTISKNLVYLELCHHRCTIKEIYTCIMYISLWRYKNKFQSFKNDICGPLTQWACARLQYCIRYSAFQSEYLALLEQCMNFACELIDLCRGTQEVEAVVSEGTGCGEPLARLKMAIRYQEKKVMNKWLLFTWMYQCLLRIYHWKILLRTLSKDYI